MTAVFDSSNCDAPFWLPGSHLQTLHGATLARYRVISFVRERVDTPDGDFIELCRLEGRPDAPRLLFLHGLEGTVRSHYVAGFFGEAAHRGWSADLLLFRGCGSEPNRAPRVYHAGDTADLAFALDHVIRESPRTPVVLAGVSLGGNVLLKFLGERGDQAPEQVVGAAAISVPFDLERSVRFIATGFSRVYDRHFLRTLRQKALAKLEQYPDLFDRARLDRARSIYEYDDAVTAPIHGFADAHDYYSQSSALGWIDRIARPTLLLSAIDDPFLPPAVLDDVRTIAANNRNLHLEFPDHGGHVGFIEGVIPWRARYYAEWRVCEFLAERLKAGTET
jgi:predicted alpha/beta-fold hydrolase